MVPPSHPYVERLIGTIRQEFLDRILFRNPQNLERKLAEFQYFYIHHCIHALLQGWTPEEAPGGFTVKPAMLNHFQWEKHCPCLIELPRAA